MQIGVPVMKTWDSRFEVIRDEHLEMLKGMHHYDLEDLEQAILFRKQQLMVKELSAHGIAAICEKTYGPSPMWPDAEPGTVRFGYILVYDPGSEGNENVWATAGECRRLIDTLANLPPAEAYARWVTKVEPFEPEEYTRQDAERDMRRERAELKRQYESGEIGAEDYAIMWRGSRSYLDLSSAGRALGARGGSVKSEAKARASRENGKRGGRPRKAK